MGKAAERVEQMMIQLTATRDFESMLLLLQLLNMLANTGDYQLLASAGYTNSLKEADARRMNEVHAYVMQNFREKITLDEVASLANMTTTSFSRYFRTHANKTFSGFVSEIRIGHACKLLAQRKISVAQVCYESGFHTLSNFNRQFRNVTGYHPLEYRRKYTETTPAY
jgi:transcriptional regulator GlxA family with amidase domain